MIPPFFFLLAFFFVQPLLVEVHLVCFRHFFKWPFRINKKRRGFSVGFCLPYVRTLVLSPLTGYFLCWLFFVTLLIFFSFFPCGRWQSGPKAGFGRPDPSRPGRSTARPGPAQHAKPRPGRPTRDGAASRSGFPLFFLADEFFLRFFCVILISAVSNVVLQL